MTWRERIVAARERGAFTEEDRRLIGNFPTCMVGEASAVLGPYAWWKDARLRELGLSDGWPVGWGPIVAVCENQYDMAEHCLNTIEDHVLELKRHGLAT